MVPPFSHRVSRVRRYSGYSSLTRLFAYRTLTFFGVLSHTLRIDTSISSAVLTPKVFLPSVWPLPRSLATTGGISFDFSSSPYLDVSVQAVPSVNLWIQLTVHRHSPMWVSPFGNLRINAHLQLPAAYRSLSRPSSAPDAKAFPLRSY